jgi:hypothetical protein
MSNDDDQAPLNALLRAARAYAPLADGTDMAAAQKAASEVLRHAYEYGGGDNAEGLRADVAARLEKAADELSDVSALMSRHERHFNESDFDELNRIAATVLRMSVRARG